MHLILKNLAFNKMYLILYIERIFFFRFIEEKNYNESFTENILPNTYYIKRKTI